MFNLGWWNRKTEIMADNDLVKYISISPPVVKIIFSFWPMILILAFRSFTNLSWNNNINFVVKPLFSVLHLYRNKKCWNNARNIENIFGFNQKIYKCLFKIYWSNTTPNYTYLFMKKVDVLGLLIVAQAKPLVQRWLTKGLKWVYIMKYIIMTLYKL